MARYAPPSCQLAGAICALFLLNACIGSLDGDDAAADYTSAADDAYEGESNTVLDLIQTGEGAEPPAKKEVKIVGDTSILATLRTFGTGGDLFSVSDKSNGIGMAFGTNSNQKDHMRLKPLATTKGISINSGKDTVGVYVDAATGKVGIGHTAPVSELHVKGTTYSSGTITTEAGGAKASLQLNGVSDYHGIQFGKDGKELYVIGRGKSIEDREMSFHIPSMAEYGGGAAPKFRWVSGNAHTTLAELESGTGNMYLKGRLGIGAMSPKSELDVRGGINIENAKGEAVITFPKGEGSGFFIRSTDNPGQSTASDNKFYIAGSNGYVGLATSSPKSMLDVRGSVNLQDATGAAIFYFPEAGKSSAMFIRCADDPSKYEATQERLYVGANGMVGVGTSKPSHGLTLDSPAALGSPLHDISIKKGNLHLSGTIHDLSEGTTKYFINMVKDSFLKRATIETSIGVGTTKPVSMKGSSAVLHVSDPAAPLVRIENTQAGGSATLELKAANSVWTAAGSTAAFKVQYNGKSHLTIMNDGKVGVGTQVPSHGLTIDSEYPEGHKNNDLSINKGELWLWGAIKQMGDDKYSFSLTKGGFIKHLNVEGKLGVGLGGKQPNFDMELGVGKVMSLGNQMFFSGESGTGYVTANLYRKANKWNLQKTDAGGSMVAFKSSGAVEISGTEKPGSTALKLMMSVNAVTQTALFPMEGVKVGVGTSSPAYPVHVVGSGKIGAAHASIAFGQAETTMGFLSANAKYVAMGTKDGEETLVLNQADGNVGIGTKSPQSALHIAGSSDAALSFSSGQSKAGTYAYIKTKPTENQGLNMVIGVRHPKTGHGRLTFDFKNSIKFSGMGNTIFNRGDTIFKTGTVAIGGAAFDPKYKLHVQGDAKIEGKCFVSKKRPEASKIEEGSTNESGAAPPKGKSPAPPAKSPPPPPPKKEELEMDFMDHLDFTDLLEEGERGSDDNSRETVELVGTMSSLSKIIRKQLKQMEEHDSKIQALTSQMTMLQKV